MTTRAQTVTILFTDLVGSTELLQRAGDEQAQRIFKAHHRLLREAVEAHGGHEVKWLGDGLMVAFDSTGDAVKCAIAMQQASRRPTAGERLEIRAGLNVGEAFVEESDYFGTSVVIARRLCDSGGAGTYGSIARVVGRLATVLERWDEAEQQFETALAANDKQGFHAWTAMTRRSRPHRDQIARPRAALKTENRMKGVRLPWSPCIRTTARSAPRIDATTRPRRCPRRRFNLG